MEYIVTPVLYPPCQDEQNPPTKMDFESEDPEPGK
jgi:hypothetical protein